MEASHVAIGSAVGILMSVLGMFTWFERRLSTKANAPAAPIIAEEMRARSVRDDKMFELLRELDKGQGEIKADVRTLTSRVGHIERHLKMNGHAGT